MSSIPLDDRLAELAEADRHVAPPLDLETRTLVAWETWRRDDESLSDRSGAGSRVRFRVTAALTGLAAAVLLGIGLLPATFGAKPLHPDHHRDSETHAAVSHETAIVPTGQVAAFRAGRAVESPTERSKVESRADPVSSVGTASVATTMSPGPPGSRGERFNTTAGDRTVRNVGPDGNRRRVARDPGEHRRAAQPPKPSTGPGSPAATATVETASFVPLGPDVERELTGAFQLARVRLSRDVLADLGVLIDAHRDGEPVQADVVFGEDGMARAIRLTPVSMISGRIP